jgi:hypothetical protein
MELLRIAEMTSLTGEPTAGATISSAQAIEEKLSRTTKPHCIVLAWVVIDVQGADHLVPTGSHLQPVGCMPIRMPYELDGRLVIGVKKRCARPYSAALSNHLRNWQAVIRNPPWRLFAPRELLPPGPCRPNCV